MNPGAYDANGPLTRTFDGSDIQRSSRKGEISVNPHHGLGRGCQGVHPLRQQVSHAIGIIHRSAEWNLGRCRPKFHKSANVLAALPTSAHPGAIKAMQEIYNAEDIDHARVAVKAFKNDSGTKFPKAVEKITSEV